MDVYRLVERSPISDAKEKHSSAGPKHRWLGAHGQAEIAVMGLMALFLAAGAFVLGDIDGDEQVIKIIAGDNITISPENGYGAVTINSTGVGGGVATLPDNNVLQIVAGENITISPENGYGTVTITAIGENGTILGIPIIEAGLGDYTFMRYNPGENWFEFGLVNTDSIIDNAVTADKIGFTLHQRSVIYPIEYFLESGGWRFGILGFAHITAHGWGNADDGPSDGDNLNYYVYTTAGTYSITLITFTQDSCGIVDVYVDGTEVGSIDQYSAGSTVNVISTVSNVAFTAGRHELGLVVDGKNGSSSSYRLWLTYIILERTA